MHPSIICRGFKDTVCKGVGIDCRDPFAPLACLRVVALDVDGDIRFC